jgi:hypothetical protein
LLLLLMPAFDGASTTHAAPGNSCGVWSIVPSPTSRAETSYLYGVGGTSSSDVWAVSYHADQSGDRQTLIRHWNGKRWSAVASPNGAHGGVLHAATALSPTNACAVGEGPLVEHWNRVRWIIVPSPVFSNDPRLPAWLRRVTPISATNIWAVGANWRASNLTLIARYTSC